MSQEKDGTLAEVQARVGASHGITDLTHKLHFYDRWAPDYDQVIPREPLPPPPCLTQPQFSYLYSGNR